MNPPNRTIYIQWLNDEGEVLDEITWCNDKIYNRDLEYITFGKDYDKVKSHFEKPDR